MTEETQSEQIAKVSLKLPVLWKQNIKLWFLQVESNFQISGITNDSTKYNTLVASIDSETMSAVSDILFNPPATDKYIELKTRMIAEFSDSENRQMRKLLSELQLGDFKPSQLLRQMRELAGTQLNDDFLKTLWMQRLPQEIQTIISVSRETLDNLAKLADKIAEVRIDSLHGVYATSYRENSSASQVSFSKQNGTGNDPPTRKSSETEIAELRGEIAALTEQLKHMSRGRDRFPTPNRRGFFNSVVEIVLIREIFRQTVALIGSVTIIRNSALRHANVVRLVTLPQVFRKTKFGYRFRSYGDKPSGSPKFKFRSLIYF